MPEWFSGEFAKTGIPLAGLLALVAVTYALSRWGLVAGIRHLVKRSAITWDDALVDARVFATMAHVAPAVVLYYGIALVPGLGETLSVLVQRLAIALVVAVTTISFNSFLSAVNEIYSRKAEYRRRPIKGYLQVIKIAISLIAALVIVATLLDKSPWVFVTSIGALTAVLMLIFKDTILSLVASVQISSNDMIHIGDWIEMPQLGADGDVVDIALHTVKVQNWDKTISTIPTHKFISESFKNWRGMSLSGGRRIKRSLYIDVNSIRFLTGEEIESFGQWALLRDYIATKVAEVESYNAQPGRDARINADIRRLTNVGTLRAYIVAYLHAHPAIHDADFTLLVRQLAPGATGLPIEIYCFSRDQDWTRYEDIQSDIFDHILAMVPEFGLRIFQEPAGLDFERLARGSRRDAIDAHQPQP